MIGMTSKTLSLLLNGRSISVTNIGLIVVGNSEESLVSLIIVMIVVAIYNTVVIFIGIDKSYHLFLSF